MPGTRKDWIVIPRSNSAVKRDSSIKKQHLAAKQVGSITRTLHARLGMHAKLSPRWSPSTGAGCSAPLLTCIFALPSRVAVSTHYKHNATDAVLTHHGAGNGIMPGSSCPLAGSSQESKNLGATITATSQPEPSR
jgi:hypothetical protein